MKTSERGIFLLRLRNMAVRCIWWRSEWSTVAPMPRQRRPRLARVASASSRRISPPNWGVRLRTVFFLILGRLFWHHLWNRISRVQDFVFVECRLVHDQVRQREAVTRISWVVGVLKFLHTFKI